MARQNDGSGHDRLGGHVLFVMEQLERLSSAAGPDGIRWTGFKLKLDADEGTSVLGVLTGFKGDVQYVAFVAGYDVVSCIMALRKKLQKDRIGWRVSRPYGQ